MILAGPATLAALMWVAPATAAPPEPAIAPVWDALAACESDRTWDANTGNGYYGGIQFSLRSWVWVGGEGMPHEASPSEQVARGQELVARQGWEAAFPACSRKLGLSGGQR